jgi:hypothetical protein
LLYRPVNVKPWIIAGAFCCSALATACGQAPDARERDLQGTSQAFEVSPGVTVSTATYRVTGPGGFASAGTVAVGSTAFVTVTLGGVPLGTGYTVALSATASNGVTTCAGASPYDVTGSSPVSVVVELICAAPNAAPPQPPPQPPGPPPGAGQGMVSGSVTFNMCPIVDGLDVTPAEARVGGHLALVATAHDSNQGPVPLSYRWRANGSLLPGLTQPSLTFTCTSVGNVALAVSAFDGDAGCNQALTATVVCSP